MTAATKRFIIASLIGLGIPLLSAGLAQAKFLASPMELYLSDAPGTRGEASVLLTNTGPDSLTVKLYLGDSRMLPEGGEAPVAAGAIPRSLADWVELDQQVHELEPGESRRVTLRLTVPPEAEGSYWSKLYIEETSAPRAATAEQQGRSYSVFMRQRVAVRLFEDVAGTGRLDARVDHVGVDALGEDRPSIVVTVANPGTLIARCTGRVEFQDERGAVIEAVPLGTRGEFWVFPGGRRDLRARPAKPLPAGTYTALAVVDFGGAHRVAGDTVVTIDAAPAKPAIRVAEDER